MDLEGLVNKAKDALKGNPNLIDKGGDAIDKVTGGKYHDQVDKAQDAVRNAVGVEDQAADKPAEAPAEEKPAAGEQTPPPSNP